MRDLHELDRFRVRGHKAHNPWGWDGDGSCGAFTMPSPVDGAIMAIIASTGEGWDHVSVSRKNRVPNWQEMEFVKRRFFRDEETAMQLHVPAADHISVHPNVLHLWRPQAVEIPLPPKAFV